MGNRTVLRNTFTATLAVALLLCMRDANAQNNRLGGGNEQINRSTESSSSMGTPSSTASHAVQSSSGELKSSTSTHSVGPTNSTAKSTSSIPLNVDTGAPLDGINRPIQGIPMPPERTPFDSSPSQIPPNRLSDMIPATAITSVPTEGKAKPDSGSTTACVSLSGSSCPDSAKTAMNIFNGIIDDPDKQILPPIELDFSVLAYAMLPYVQDSPEQTQFTSAAVSPIPSDYKYNCTGPGQDPSCCPESHLGDLGGGNPVSRWTGLEPLLGGVKEAVEARIQKCIDLCNEKQRNREENVDGGKMSCSPNTPPEQIGEIISKINKLLDIEFKYYDMCFAATTSHPGTGADDGHYRKWADRIKSLLDCWKYLDRKLVSYLSPEFLIREILESDWYEELVLEGAFNKSPYNELITIIGRPSPPTVQPVKPVNPPSGWGWDQPWWIIGCPSKESAKCVISGGGSAGGTVGGGAAAASFWFFINPGMLNDLFPVNPVMSPPPA